MKTEKPQSRKDSVKAKNRIRYVLAKLLTKLYRRPDFECEMPIHLEQKRAIRLIRGLVFCAIDRSSTALAAGQQALESGIAALTLKASLPHGVLGQIFAGLPLSPAALSTVIRETNRLAELPKGWLGYRVGGPQRKIDVSDLRKDPKLREVLDSGLIYADMESCGSQNAFRFKFCPSIRTETPEAKCRRSLSQVERWSEDLDVRARMVVRDHLAALCRVFGIIVQPSESRSGSKAKGVNSTVGTTADPQGNCQNNHTANFTRSNGSSNNCVKLDSRFVEFANATVRDNSANSRT